MEAQTATITAAVARQVDPTMQVEMEALWEMRNAVANAVHGCPAMASPAGEVGKLSAQAAGRRSGKG